eukprot:NODE_2158_length_974_cov_84.090811_g1772_i0.p1 GENE.NODE_2158_length_974_cov_84.090811_g1772_i0~~NODE_2158_length_974_cov_84.090811_g1772_i0.p1  ORF type:complete len:189 (-),score=38.86 NODE_2158_length_974_cov_84.090811_g1772_i0:59-625(-)
MLRSAGSALAAEQSLWEMSGCEMALLVSDMSGFSRITRSCGIIHSLSLIAQCQSMCDDLIKQSNGRILRYEADNVFACFQEPMEAVAASLLIHSTLKEYNTKKQENEQLLTCHGIGYGRMLMIGRDMFGEASEMATRLGEDVAEPYDTLVTEAVVERCMHADWSFEAHQDTQASSPLMYFSVHPLSAK